MNAEERSILLCMTDEPRSPVAIAETVAEFTGATKCTKSYVVVTFFRLLRMAMKGLVDIQDAKNPNVLPLMCLTAKGLELQEGITAENSEIQLRVYCAHLYTRSAIANRASAY